MSPIYYKAIVRFLSLIGIAALWLIQMSNSWATDTINIYTYHNKPPYYFIHNDGKSKVVKGIYQDFIHYVNTQQNEVQLKLTFVPRVRLENALKERRLDGGIIGVNPLWFGDKAMSTYQWSSPIMQDRDVLIVLEGETFDYSHPKNLEGRTLALLRGLYYWGVTERVKQGKITALMTDAGIQNLSLVSHGRADATILSQLTAEYYFTQQGSAERFEILATPHDEFERRLLFPRSLFPQFKQLKKHINNALNSPVWVKQLSKWQHQ